MTKRSCWIGALIVFAAALVYFTSYIEYGLAYDEGYLLDGVERVMEGQVIYRDFHHTYAPGRFYAVAAAFEVFGKSLIVERFVFALLQALKCSLAFLIVSMVTGSWLALLAPVLIMIAPGPWHKVFFSSLGMLAAYTMMVCIPRKPPWLLIAGVIVGICAVFRQDSAGFAVIGGLIGMAIDRLAGEKGDSALFWGRPKIGRCPLFLRRLGYFVCGIAMVGVPVLLYFHAEGALAAMVHKISVDGMIDNMTNQIPYPGLTARMPVDSTYLARVLPVRLLFYLPFVAYALSLLIVVRQAVLRRWNSAMTSFLVVLAVSIMAFNQSVWRSDLGHLLQTMQYVFLLVTVLITFASSAVETRLGARAGLASILKLLLAVAVPALLVWASVGIVAATTDRATIARFRQEGLSVGDTEYLGSAAVRAGNDTKLSLQRAPVYVTRGEAGFFTAVGQFLHLHTEPGDYVLAVPQLQMLYFFYDRRNPTAYAHYRRALEPEEEDRYIESIRSRQTEYIFFSEPFEGARLGQTKQSFSEYAKRVRDWILDNYVVVESKGSVKILRRKT